jgi:hypothetical protein
MSELICNQSRAKLKDSYIIYRKNPRLNVDQLKFRIDLNEGLLVQCSFLREVSIQHDGGNIQGYYKRNRDFQRYQNR